MSKKIRKSSVYTDKKGYTYYQTYSFYGSINGKKKKIQKTIPKGYSKTQMKNECELWDKYFNDVDSKYKSGNPFTKPPTPLSLMTKMFKEDDIKKLKLGDISPTTVRINRENINLFRDWFISEYSDRNVHRIETSEIEEYMNHRKMKKSPSGNRLSPNTVRINLRVVRSFFKWCVKKRYMDYSPFTEGIEIPSYSSRKDEDVPLGKDWKKLYEFIERSISYKSKGTDGETKYEKFNDNDWFKYVIYIMCNTGMRGGEVRLLKWKKGQRDSPSQRHPYSYLDKDFKNIHIFFKGTYGVLPISQTPLPSLFKELKKSKGNTDFIFQSPITGLPYDKSIFNKMFRQLMVNLNMVNDDGENKYTPHSIRHSVVSHLVSQGENIYTIQKLCRHKSIRTTMDIYSHLFNQDLENIMGKIGG